MSNSIKEKMTVEEKCQWVDMTWPLNKTREAKISTSKATEKDWIKENFADENIWEEFKAYVGAMLADTKPNKIQLPLVVMRSFLKKKNLLPVSSEEQVQLATSSPFVNKLASQPSNEDKEAEAQFEDIWKIWPVNYEFRETKPNARKAFLGRMANIREENESLTQEDLVLACKAYANEFNSSFSGSVYPKSLRKFVENDDIICTWLEKVRDSTDKTPDVSEKREYFDAMWSWYPDFKLKDSEKIVRDSFNAYRRYINDENVVDFYCTVQQYASEVKRAINHGETDSKFTKGFLSFFIDWKAMNPYEKVADLLYGPFYKALLARKLDTTPGGMMFLDGDMMKNVLLYHGKSNGKRTLGVLEAAVKCLYQEFVKTDVDFSMVGEVYAQAKLKAKRGKDFIERLDDPIKPKDPVEDLPTVYVKEIVDENQRFLEAWGDVQNQNQDQDQDQNQD